MSGKYEPRVFDAPNIAQAKRIVLTAEDSTTDERWARETPYITDLILHQIKLGANSLVVDYGCGIGRIARSSLRSAGDVLIERKIDAAISVWVLQHCERPEEDAARIDRALCSTGRLFVVNNLRRAGPMMTAVLGPTGPQMAGQWVDDEVDIKSLLASRFEIQQEGRLAPEKIAPSLRSSTFWALFGQNGRHRSSVEHSRSS